MCPNSPFLSSPVDGRSKILSASREFCKNWPDSVYTAGAINLWSLFLGLFTLGLIAQAFIRSAGNGVKISLPASPANQNGLHRRQCGAYSGLSFSGEHLPGDSTDREDRGCPAQTGSALIMRAAPALWHERQRVSPVDQGVSAVLLCTDSRTGKRRRLSSIV